MSALVWARASVCGACASAGAWPGLCTRACVPLRVLMLVVVLCARVFTFRANIASLQLRALARSTAFAHDTLLLRVHRRAGLSRRRLFLGRRRVACARASWRRGVGRHVGVGAGGGGGGRRRCAAGRESSEVCLHACLLGLLDHDYAGSHLTSAFLCTAG
eukprot:6200350-Pleurochrysis_carterae.AAC.3